MVVDFVFSVEMVNTERVDRLDFDKPELALFFNHSISRTNHIIFWPSKFDLFSFKNPSMFVSLNYSMFNGFTSIKAAELRIIVFVVYKLTGFSKPDTNRTSREVGNMKVVVTRRLFSFLGLDVGKAVKGSFHISL